MIPYIGDFAEDEEIYHYFNTFDSNDPSGSVTITDLADTDIFVYKDGSVTDLVTDGATVVIDFDGRTGVHKITIDTSVHADYSVGSDYMVLVNGTTVDTGTVTAALFTFSIENRYNDVNVASISANAITATAIAANAITAAKIATDAITNAKIAAGAITSTEATSVAGAVLADTSSDAIIADAVWNAATATYGDAGSYGLLLETDLDATISSRLASSSAPTNFASTVISAGGIVDVNVQEIDSVAQAATNLEILMDGNEAFYTAYAGPRGPGVYIDDTNGTAGSTTGVHGTAGNPTTTIASAITLCTALGFNRVYLVANTDITLAATMEDYEFVGIGDASANSVALASQDVDRSGFFNLSISGVQAGTERAYFERCIFGTATIHSLARWCGFTDSVTGVTLSNNDDNIFEGCFSMVAGNATPIFICSGANLDLSIRHYSGGVELQGCSATTTVSVETDGQVIIDATSSTSATVTVRGCASITDNAGLGASLTVDAVYNAGNINSEVVDVLKTDTITDLANGAPPDTPTFEEAVMYLYSALTNQVEIDTSGATDYKEFYNGAGTIIWRKVVTTDANTYTEAEGVSGS